MTMTRSSSQVAEIHQVFDLQRVGEGRGQGIGGERLVQGVAELLGVHARVGRPVQDPVSRPCSWTAAPTSRSISPPCRPTWRLNRSMARYQSHAWSMAPSSSSRDPSSPPEAPGTSCPGPVPGAYPSRSSQFVIEGVRPLARHAPSLHSRSFLLHERTDGPAGLRPGQVLEVDRGRTPWEFERGPGEPSRRRHKRSARPGSRPAACPRPRRTGRRYPGARPGSGSARSKCPGTGQGRP